MLSLLAVVVAGVLVGTSPPRDQRDVVLRLGAQDPVAWPVVDALADGDVLRVRVSGAEAGTTGTVVQCSTTCWNRFPVTVDGDGTTRFQYQLERRDCDPTTTCLVRVEVGAGAAVAFTVFGGPAPPAPTITVAPAGPVAPGDRVTVTVDGLQPDAPARVAFCAGRCERDVVAAADEDGRTVVDVTIGERCSDCGLVVTAGPSRTVVPVRFVAPPTPGYDGARLAASLAVAAILLVLAWWLVAATDWRPPSEAAVPDAGP